MISKIIISTAIFFSGAIFGMLAMALCSMAKRCDETDVQQQEVK